MPSTDSQPLVHPGFPSPRATSVVFPPGFPRPFGQKYTLLRELGAGGMGRLFLAVAGEAGLRRVCAIKTLTVEHGEAQAEELRSRFQDEARVVVQLSNENLAYVFDVGLEDGEHYLAMEHIQGKTLAEMWNRYAEREMPFSFGTSLYVILEILAGLAYVHDFQELGLVHRDISPSNVMVSYGGAVKLIDFGVATWRDRATRTHAGIQWGKNSYKSPEQHLGQSVDQRADLFSVGVILWELLAGRQLFPEGELRPLRPEIPPPSVHNHDVPPELDAIALKALAFHRKDRYQSARLFQEALALHLRVGDAKVKLGYLMSSLFEREIVAEGKETQGLVSLVPETVSAAGKARPIDSEPTRRRSTSDGPLVGLVLEGRYEVMRLIGQGSMGVVYECYHRGIGKRVAVKLPNPNERDPETIGRLMIEAQAAGRIDHPNVARVTDSGRTPDGAFFLAMDYLEGRGLDQIIQQEAPLDWPRAAGIVVQIARALGAAHAVGIIHRDLKPSNVMIVAGPSGEEQVRVLDFGLAKVVGLDLRGGVRDDITRPGFMLGTPRYMAPEQIARGEVVDHRADLYALATILYELLTKHAPYEGDTPEAVCQAKIQEDPAPIEKWRPQAPPGVGDLIMMGLARSPSDRAQSAVEIERVLTAMAQAAVSSAARRRPVARTPMPRQTALDPRRALMVGGAAVIAVIGAMGIGSVTLKRQRAVAPDPLNGVAAVGRLGSAQVPEGSSPSASEPAPLAQGRDQTTAPPSQMAEVAPSPSPLPLADAPQPQSAGVARAGTAVVRRPPPGEKTATAIAAALDQAEDSYRTGRIVDALKFAQRAFRLGGGIESRLVLGRIYLQMQRFADAEREYVEVLKAAPENEDAQKGLERVQSRR